MRRGTAVAVVVLVACGVVFLVHQINSSMEPAVPKDMPGNSKFLASGFDIANDEPQGDWVACMYSREDGSDWCRVTDQKGIVLYQGDFVPLDSGQPLSDNRLMVAARNPKNLWVQGPVEQSQVPVIPLQDGSLLVPAADRYALSQRWAKDANEYNQIMNGSR